MNNEEKTGGLVGSLARFTGVEELGRGIAGAILPYTKEGKQLESQLQSGSISPDDYLGIRFGTLTPKDIVSSAGQTALSVAGLTGKIPAGVKGGALYGGLSGGLQSLKDEKKGFVQESAKGAAIGAVIGLVSDGLSKAIKKIPEYQETLARKVLRQGTPELRAESSGLKPVLAKQFVKSGLAGSEENMLRKSAEKIATLEKQIQDIVSRNKNTSINTVDLVRSLDNIVERKRNIYGQSGVDVINNFKKILLDKGGKLSIPAANKLKRDIYKELGEATFNTEVLSQNRELLRTIASSLKQEIGKVIPRVDSLNKQQQFSIRVVDNLERVLSNKRKLNLMGLSDAVLAGGGIAAGDPLVGIGGAMIKRALETAQFKTRAIPALGVIEKVAQGIPETVKDIGQAFVTRRMTRD